MTRKRPTFTYTIELDEEMFPRHIADQLNMLGYFVRHLVSVTDNQPNAHVYGATYHCHEANIQ